MPKSNDAKAEKSAERFFGALRDVFVGAPVQRTRAKGEEKDEGERRKDKVRDLSLIPSPLSLLSFLYPFSFIPFFLGQSGFINLMRIKSRYYDESGTLFLLVSLVVLFPA